MIVLDTSALSHAFRRRPSQAAPHPCVRLLEQLIADDAELAVPGVVFQELLSGVRGARKQARLEDALAGFPLLLATRPIHRRAAALITGCRRRGIAAATVDALIAATTIELDGQLLTTDEDFVALTACSELALVDVPPG